MGALAERLAQLQHLESEQKPPHSCRLGGCGEEAGADSPRLQGPHSWPARERLTPLQRDLGMPELSCAGAAAIESYLKALAASLPLMLSELSLCCHACMSSSEHL